ncbi:MAG TPA: GAF domain-containing protein, partial [Myxococcaceae bacterium]|nr:GAF domain-containing protein [Myxococcaceae bacterium]
MQLKPTPRPDVGDLAFALEASGEGLLLHDSSGRVVLANTRAVRLLGFASVEELHGKRGVEPWSRVEWLDDRYMPFPPEHLPPMVALTGAQPQPLRLQLRPRNQGEEKWLEVWSRIESDEGGSVRRIATVLRELPSAAPRSETHLRFLSEVTQLMTSSLDPRGTLRALALRAVPELADACSVDLLDDDGTVQLAAIVCTDALKEQRFRELRRTHRPRPDAPFSTARVLLTGKPMLHRQFTDADLQAMATSDQHLRWLREMRLTSAIAVALVARDHVLGVLSLVSTESGRRYDEEDLAFATELASRAALVVEHGRLHHRAETALRRKDDEVRVNEALGRLGTALASELDGDRLAQRIVDEATALTGAQFGVLLHHLPPEGGGPAQPYAYCGLDPEDFARFPTAATHALFCPALRTEPVIRSDDLAADPRFAQQPALRDFVLPVASILAVPITSRSGAVMGGLFLGHVAAGVFTP